MWVKPLNITLTIRKTRTSWTIAVRVTFEK